MFNRQFSGLSTKIFIFPLINRHIFIMPIPFGFSVGDFITLISLAIKICQALDEFSDVLKEYQDVRQELQSFHHAVEGLENAVSRGYAISERSAEKLHDILRGCTQALNEFQDFLSSYKEMKRLSKKISWVIFGQSKRKTFRSRIQANMVIIGLIQQEMQR